MKKVILIVLAVLVLGAIGLGSLFFIGIRGISTREPTAAEKTMLLTSEVFEQYGFTNLFHETCGSYSAKLNIDGSTEVEFEYDNSLHAESDVFYLQSDAMLEPTEKDAEESFKIMVGAMKVGLKIGGCRAEEQAGLCTLGDRNYAATIFNAENYPAGTMAVIRNGRIMHSLMVVGIYFDTREDLEELLAPVISGASPEKFGTD